MSGYYWLASYPKSGNTWLRLALDSLERGGAAPNLTDEGAFAPIASDRRAFDRLLDVDSADLTDDESEALRPRFYEMEASRAAGPLLRKVHDAWVPTLRGEPLFPPAVTLGAVCIVRDPRDVAVSLAHFAGMDPERAVAFLNRPDAALATRGTGRIQLHQRLLTWSAHVLSWLEAPVAPLLLRYEDMLDDPAAALARVARHLGRDAPPDAVARAVAATRFDALRTAEQRHGYYGRSAAGGAFFRRGVAGGWRDTLAAALADRIERDHGAVMERLGYR